LTTTITTNIVGDNVQIAFGAMNVDGASVTASEADPGLKYNHRAIVEAYWHPPVRKYLKYGDLHDASLVSLFPHRVVPSEPRSQGPASGWQVPPENFVGAGWALSWGSLGLVNLMAAPKHRLCLPFLLHKCQSELTLSTLALSLALLLFGTPSTLVNNQNAFLLGLLW
jgi:hypothetical protein